MRNLSLTVNGAPVTAPVAPRTHLADFLRETCLLTGTHLGCEHGVCGACTILLDGSPARSCIAFAAACEGADIRTIEGLDDDPVTQRLRATFTAEHALQCGYCTPGMLVTARDIVLRLPHADAARIRLELAGNLCRCTGYSGIVRAIARVLAEFSAADQDAVAEASAPAASLAFPAPSFVAPAAMPDLDTPPATSGPGFTLRLHIARSRAEIWAALADPAKLVACVPGASLTSIKDGVMQGRMQVSLGPVTATFTGTGRLTLDAGAWTACLTGQSNDQASQTRLTGSATITLAETGPATEANVTVTYRLTGPLSQLARPSIVRTVAGALAETVARNLEGTLSQPAKLSVVRLLLGIIRTWFRRRA